MKLHARVRRRSDGSFQAVIETTGCREVWACAHRHPYGTSNRVKQDSASKCGHAELRRLREEAARGQQAETEEAAA